MSNQTASMTPAQIGILKLGAAARFRELGVRPATSEYVLTRYLQKRAAKQLTPSPAAVKLASELAKAVQARRGQAAAA
jgi:hypothetical protein